MRRLKLERRRAALQRAATKAEFIERVLKDEESGERVENNWHHLEWLELAQLHRYLLLPAAREHAKTNLLAIGECLYEIGADLNVRILIISDVYDKSQSRTRVLRNYIEADPDYQREFPAVAIAHKEGDEEFTAKRDRILKESTVTSTYAGAPISGGRYDRIICDDLVNLIKNSQTPEARKKLRRWFYRDVMNSLTRTGKLTMLGTPQQFDDLHADVEADKRFYVAKYPGVDEEETGWGQLGYRQKNEARGVRGKDALCLWPAMHSYATHMEKKENQFEEYLSQQQLQSVSDTGLVYRRSLVEAALERGKSVRPDPGAAQFLGLDPGYGKRAALLAIQERSGDRVDLWGEYSFTQCDDDAISGVAVAHARQWAVAAIHIDAEDAGLAAAISRDLTEAGLDTEVVRVPFAKYKKLAIKATRWLLSSGRLSWAGERTTVYKPGRVVVEPSLFRAEVRDYALRDGYDDEPIKEADHGPDAWAAYAVRWIEAWAAATGQQTWQEEEPVDRAFQQQV